MFSIAAAAGWVTAAIILASFHDALWIWLWKRPVLPSTEPRNFIPQFKRLARHHAGDKETFRDEVLQNSHFRVALDQNHRPVVYHTPNPTSRPITLFDKN